MEQTAVSAILNKEGFVCRLGARHYQLGAGLPFSGHRGVKRSHRRGG